MSFKRDQSNNILSNLEQNCVLQINKIKMIESRQDTEIVTGNVAGQIRCNLSMFNIGGFSNNYLGVQPPLRSNQHLKSCTKSTN